jgi:hypothetical protein
MATVLYPWQILVAAMAGWITRQQDAVIDYLREENRVLKDQLGRKRLRLTDAQRRRLAVRGKAIGRRALTEVASLVTPDTILRWHRQLIAQKWTYKRRYPGRPRVMEIITDMVVRLPHRSPNLNAYAERFVRSIKDECLNRMIFFGERSLRKATREYAAHYHRERNHQGIDNRLIAPLHRSIRTSRVHSKSRSAEFSDNTRALECLQQLERHQGGSEG